MSDRLRHGGPRRVLAARAVVPAVGALVLLVVGALVVVLALRDPGVGPPRAPVRTETSTGADQAAVPGPVQPIDPPADAPTDTPADTRPGTGGPAAAAPDLGPVMPAADPVSLRIPSIGVASDVLEPLALDADGVLPAPADYALPGWYTGGPNPGQLGPAVVAGHVDGPDGPAVFYRLGGLAVGATVEVGRSDGTVATFVVDAVERYAKADFPTARVYGNTTDRAEIRLITCGGAFDRTTGHYVDNIVVFGHLVA